MVQTTYWGGVGLGLALLLVACNGAAVEAPAGSAEVRSAAVDEAMSAEPTVVEPAAVTAGETPQATTAAIVEPTSPDETGTEEMAAVQPEQGQEEAVVMTEQSKADKMEDSPEEVAAAEPGPTEAQRQLLANLTIKGRPAELHNEVWLNSDPLKLAGLRGKVAIVEFWTFG